MTQKYACRISAHHASLPGHFPGHPVVPGVVLLTEVSVCARRFIENPIRFTGMPAVKFTYPLLPEVDFEIHIEHGKPGNLKFQCLQGDTQLASGSLSYAPV